jgi:hypothetical protein
MSLDWWPWPINRAPPNRCVERGKGWLPAGVMPAVWRMQPLGGWKKCVVNSIP